MLFLIYKYRVLKIEISLGSIEGKASDLHIADGLQGVVGQAL